MATKQELMNEIAKYERLQEEQPEKDFSAVIDKLWRELFQVLDREFGKDSTFGKWPYNP